MKKYITQIIVLILLALLAFSLHQYRRGTTLGRKEMAFAITGLERVSEIIISGDEGKINLKRENGKWILNSRYEAREKAVEMLLQTLARLRVSRPTPISALEEVNDKFYDESFRVDVVSGRRSKIFYVYSDGPESPTYMLKHGASQPFIIEVLGYSGHVASLFVSDETYWRKNVLFNYSLNEIAEVTVYKKDNEEGSFMLRQLPDKQLCLYKYPGIKKLEEINDSLAIRFLANFFYIRFERFANTDERMLIDSLVKADPDYMIRVAGHNESISEVFFHKIIMENSSGADSMQHDLFRLHALFNDRSDMVIVPYHSVDLILRTSSYFYYCPK